nr:immunoglobulin heavy chain junction region [Macaca mulatta]MOW25608.1 immunoglobulin heavy chain junction region [Macaca mulatta]MOW27166.1 immunoglobulin heavy chain junction region [Macaca mulatta]
CARLSKATGRFDYW